MEGKERKNFLFVLVGCKLLRNETALLDEEMRSIERVFGCMDCCRCRGLLHFYELMCVCVCVYECICMCMYVYECVYMYVYMYVCVCIGFNVEYKVISFSACGC